MTPCIKVLVRSATGKRFTDRLPNISLIHNLVAFYNSIHDRQHVQRYYLLGYRGQGNLITLSPPLNGRIFGASVLYTIYVTGLRSVGELYTLHGE